MPTLPPRRHKTFRERILDSRNRRSTNIEDRSRNQSVSPFDSAGYPPFDSSGMMPEPDLNKPIPLYPDRSAISEDQRQEDRATADSRASQVFKKRGLRHVRLSRSVN